MVRYCSPNELKELIETSEGEYALIDVREEGAFSESRLLAASCLPLSRLELRAHKLLPCLHTPIVLMDGGGDGLAEQGHERLAALGYSALSILRGGVPAWQAEGYSVYGGVNVRSKAFGEIVYETCGTPDISAETLSSWMADGRNIAIFDSRPYAEYQEQTIPGSVSVPGAELAYRVPEYVRDPDTTVVINCAGRTRSIIGCQSLVNAGFPNDIFCLRNGTMGWKLAGFELEYGSRRRIDVLSPQTRERAKACLDRVAERYEIRFTAHEDLVRELAQHDGAVYFFDVRTPEEFAQGHLPFAVNAPGGQLVQATDDYVAVQSAKIILIDPEQIRAVMTASWLKQLGFEDVFVLQNVQARLSTGQRGQALPYKVSVAAFISVEDLLLKFKTSSDMLLLDVATSVKHKAGHIPSAAWAMRGRYADIRRCLHDIREIVVTGDDADLIALVSSELAAETGVSVYGLRGGNAAWRRRGYPLISGFEKKFSACDDVWYKPFEYDDPDDEREAANKYLKWEVELTEKIESDGIAFALFPPSGASGELLK